MSWTGACCFCKLAFMSTWSSGPEQLWRYYTPIPFRRDIQSISPSSQPIMSIYIWMSYPGKERIPLTLETLTTFPSVFSRWGTASIVRCSTARTLVAITLCKVDPIIMRKFNGSEAAIVPGAFLHSELAVGGGTFLWNNLS